MLLIFHSKDPSVFYHSQSTGKNSNINLQRRKLLQPQFDQGQTIVVATSDSSDRSKEKKGDQKTLRRLAQNREAARKSRLRKKLHSKKRNRLDHKRLNDLVFVKFNAMLKTKLLRTKRDPIASQSFEEGHVAEWMVRCNSTEILEDEDEEVFPGEGLTWQQVSECMDTNLEPRKSSRQPTSKKASIVKGKRKLVAIEEAEEDEEDEEDNMLEDDFETDASE